MGLLSRLSPDQGNFFDLSQLSCARVGNIKKNGQLSKVKPPALAKAINQKSNSVWGMAQLRVRIQQKCNIYPSKKLYFRSKKLSNFEVSIIPEMCGEPAGA